MLRTIALSLMLLLSVGVMLPFANSAHGLRQTSQVGSRSAGRYRSRAWWRRYRARLRKKRAAAAAAAAAALALRNATWGQTRTIPLAEIANAPLPTLTNEPVLAANPTQAPVKSETVVATPVVANSVSSAAPTTVAPATAQTSVAPAKASDVKQPAKSVAPKLPGQMNVSVVAMSRPNPAFLTAREEKRMVGGTAVADLRRIVIDKLIVSGGWVTNDYVKEVNGARIFVVTARTPREAGNPEKAWTFYFTEAEGRIYSLTTDAPLETADRMSEEAERFINRLHASSQPNNR